MSMSTHVHGILECDRKFKRMKKIYDACVENNTDIPEEVERYFGEEPPDDKGIVIDLARTKCCKEYGMDGEDGFEIDLTKIPSGVKIIRVFNSW